MQLYQVDFDLSLAFSQKFTQHLGLNYSGTINNLLGGQMDPEIPKWQPETIGVLKKYYCNLGFKANCIFKN